MGLFADIQDAVASERRQTRLLAEQEKPAPVPTPEAVTPQAQAPTPAPTYTPAPTPTHTPTPAPAPPQSSPIGCGDLAASSIQRIKGEVERITRRNMKDAVAEYLVGLCAKDSDLAGKVVQPQKSMVKCFQYITRKAREYAEQERKDTGNTEAAYGCDVPDDLCYQWAVDYFNDPNADKEPAKKAPQKTTTPKTPNRTPAATKAPTQPKADAPVGGSYEQMTLLGGIA